MFSQLICLLLVLLFIAFEPNGGFLFSPLPAFAWGTLLYLALLSLIAFQNRLFSRINLFFVAHLEFFLFLALARFYFSSFQFIALTPFIGRFQIASSLFIFLLYGGFLFSYYQSRSFLPRNQRNRAARAQLKALFPFALPFFCLTLASDLFSLYAPEKTVFSWKEIAFFLFLSASLFALLPFFIQWIWKAPPLEEGALKERFERICQKTNFTHGGLLIWNLFPHALTAMILGLVPRFRYILFTEKILREFPPEELEAILIHEIGHSRHKHLFLYPWIFLGMTAVLALFSLLFGPSLFSLASLLSLLYPSSFWTFAGPSLFFACYASLIALYFRFVFGFFSRLFERQADLYIVEIGENPEQMIAALDRIGVCSGHTRHVPNWHHYSLQERIDCLAAAKKNPLLAQKHARRVKRALFLYSCALAIGGCAVLAPLFSEASFFKKISQEAESLSQSLQMRLNRPLFIRLARRYAKSSHLRGDARLIEEAYLYGLTRPHALSVQGVAEYYVASFLLEKGEILAAAQTLASFWQEDLSSLSPSLIRRFRALTERAIRRLSLEQEEQKALRNALQRALFPSQNISHAFAFPL